MASPQENSAAFTRLNAYFGQIYKASDPGPWANLAENVASDALTEHYSFPGGTPRLRRLTGDVGGSGETPRSDINLYAHDLTNHKFAVSVPVDEVFIITGKLGSVLPSVSEMAAAAARWQGDLVIEQLLGYAGFKGYDGKPLFDAAHKDGRQSQSNLIAGTGITAAAVSKDLAAASVAKAGFKDDRGQLISDAVFDTVVIPMNAGLSEAFKVIAGGDQAQGAANWSGDIKRVLMLPGWTGNSWMIFDTRPGVKALITQELQAPTTYWDRDGERTEGDMLFAARAFGEAGVGNWRRAVLVQNA